MNRVWSGALAGSLLLAMCKSEKPEPVPSAVPAPTVGSSVPQDSPPGPGAPGSWTVTPRSVGPIRFGMTVASARAALRDSLAGVPEDGSCVMVTPTGAPAGVTLMVEKGQVVRVDVDSGNVVTDHGARVGYSDVVVKERYGDSLVVTPHKYDEKSRYLTFVPPGPDGSQFRVIFESNGIRVTTFRAGIRPAVEYVERCG